MNLTRLMFRGSLLGVIDQLLRAVAALFVTPVMVGTLGAGGYGIWVIITSCFSQYILLDLGITASLPHFMARALGKKDEQEVREVATSAAIMLARVVVVGGAVTALGWGVVPLFVHTSDGIDKVRAILVVLGVANAIFTMAKVFVADLNSHLRKDIVCGVSIVRVTSCSLLAWWVLVHGYGLLGLAWVHGGGTVVEALVLVLWNRRLLAYMRLRWSSATMRRAIRRYAGWSYALTTSERLRGALDPVLLGWLRSSAATGQYAIGVRPVALYYDMAYSIMGGQLLPAFSRLQTSGDRGLLERTFVIGARVSALIAALGAGWLMVIGPIFLRCWLPAQAAAALPVLWCLTGPYMLYAAQIPSVHLLYSYAAHRRLAIVFVAGVIVNLALSAVFIMAFGIVGAAAGTAVEMTVVYGVILPWLVIQQTGLPTRQVYGQLLFQPLLRGLLITCPIGLISANVDPTWLSVIVLNVAYLAWCLIATFVGLVGKEEKAWFLHVLKFGNMRPEVEKNADPGRTS